MKLEITISEAGDILDDIGQLDNIWDATRALIQALTIITTGQPTHSDWSASVIAAGLQRGTVPRYGSHEWLELPTTDPRFVAAVAIAAETWRDHCDSATIRRDLELELIAARQL